MAKDLPKIEIIPPGRSLLDKKLIPARLCIEYRIGVMDAEQALDFAQALHQEATRAYNVNQCLLSTPSCGVLAGEPEIIGERCADGGKCNHSCATECFRKNGCLPLTASCLTDDWKDPMQYGKPQE